MYAYKMKFYELCDTMSINKETNCVRILIIQVTSSYYTNHMGHLSDAWLI